ncbi:MAG TPA: CHAT domain-containing protein [Longimicrobium sp.]|nr:CHAT domain-containing protein [Longimicrobium sp.]
MSKVKVLFVAADPESANPDRPDPRLLLDEDVRRIREKVRAAEYRDALEFHYCWAARPDDLLQALNELSPRVVHFSGHGGVNGLVLVGEDGEPQTVPAAALTRLFETFRGEIRLVLLIACHTLELAHALAPCVGCAIGSRGALPDEAGILFGASFYRALAFGKSVQAAFQQASALLLMEGFGAEVLPELVAGPGVDPAALVLVSPYATHDPCGHREPRAATPEIRQELQVMGNRNTVNVVAGDLYGALTPA